MSAGERRGGPLEGDTVRNFLERRARALQELAAGLAAVDREETIPVSAAERLSRFSGDLPFLLAYRLDPAGKGYSLAAGFGMDASEPAVSPDAEMPWRFAEALRGRRIVEQEFRPDGNADTGGLPGVAFVIPVDLPNEEHIPMVLVAGAAQGLSQAPEYRAFHELVRVMLAGAVQTVRARQAADAAANAASEREKLFRTELQHGVRNTLAVIRTIVRRTAEATATVEDFSMHLEGRIDAFARAQAAAARSANLGIDLASIVADELLTAAAQEDSNLTIEGPPVRLRPKAAESLALTIHELATNALKHGALSVVSGRIAVEWALDERADPPRLDFQWKERGLDGLSPAPPRRGFGSELLERTLPYELRAETSLFFEPDGFKCRIALPLDRILAGDGPMQDD
jgi:two-component sensor histidine kinase